MTNIRCAVVEGSHQCESSCHLLQGHQLGDPIPLVQSDIPLPPGCTLFKKVETHVFYPKNKDMVLDHTAKVELRSFSKTVAELKTFIVKDTWAQWMTKVLDEIVAHDALQNVIYEHQTEFFLEDVYHRNISLDTVRSNQIKKYLHEILTNAIFEYNPCKELLLILKKATPNKEEWSGDSVFWLSLKANTFTAVITNFCDLFLNSFSQMLFFSALLQMSKKMNVIDHFLLNYI